MSYQSEVLADVPVGYWKLDEAAASATAADTSGNALTGTYSGTETTGVTPLIPVGQATTFANGKATTASSALLKPGTGGAMTLEAWVKTTSAAIGGIICSDNASGAGRLFQFRLDATGHVNLIVFNAAGTSNVSALSTATVNDGTTHYVVATYDGANIRIYIDSNLDSTTACALTGSTGSHAVALGGQLAGAGATPFVGTLDELAFYTTALSAARVAVHGAAGSAAGGKDWLSQEAVESIEAGTAGALISQEVVEVVESKPTNSGGLSQEAVEAARSKTSIVVTLLSQEAIEVLIPAVYPDEFVPLIDFLIRK